MASTLNNMSAMPLTPRSRRTMLSRPMTVRHTPTSVADAVKMCTQMSSRRTCAGSTSMVERPIGAVADSDAGGLTLEGMAGLRSG